VQATPSQDPSHAAPPPLSAPPQLSLWRRLLPPLLAAALLCFVLWRIDWAAFVGYLARAHYPAFVAFMAAFVLALLSADVLAARYVYRRAVATLSFRELWAARAASYLPSLLNYHLGQAWLTYFLSRGYGVDLRRVTGATLLAYASWGGCILVLGCIAWTAAGRSTGWLALPLGAGLVYLALLALKPAPLGRNRVLGPLFEAGVRGHLVAMALRLPHLVVLFVGTWLPFWFFGVRIPLEVALTYVSILIVALTLPITPSGVGTRDALAAAFFAPYAAGASAEQQLAAVAASTTCTAAVLVLIEAAVGMVFMRRASRLLRERKAARPTREPSGDPTS